MYLVQKNTRRKKNMKMRKRIAALLAVAMVAALMPMTAFAASENRVSKVAKVAQDTLLEENDRPTLNIKLKDGMSSGQAFYVTLDGAYWSKAGSTGFDTEKYEETNGVIHSKDTDAMQAEVARESILTGAKRVAADKLAISFDGDDLEITAVGNIDMDDVISIALSTFVEDAEATVAIDGHTSSVDDMDPRVFAKTSDDGSINLIVGDAKDFAKKGDFADITIREPYKGAFHSETQKLDADERLSFTVELRDSDFTFDVSDAKITGKKGFSRLSDEATVAHNRKENGDIIEDELRITLPKASQLAGKEIGEFVIEDVEVSAKLRAAQGEVRATARNVKGKLLNGTQTFTGANHTDFSTELKMKEEYEVRTGHEVEVEFTLAEQVEDSLLNNRTIEFNISNGAKFKDGSVEVKAGNSDVDSGNDVTTSFQSGLIKVDDASNKYDRFDFDKFKRATGEKAEYVFKATIFVPNNFDGDEVILTAEGNALTETHEVVAAKVIRPIEVEVTPVDIKVGLRQQVGGKIVIKETEKEAILRNYTDERRKSVKDAKIQILIEDGDRDLQITDADIAVTEGDLLLDLDGKVVSDGMITIPVKRQSTKPSTIEVTNIEITANRNVPEGKYDIKVGGQALSKNTQLFEFYDDGALKDDVYGEEYYMDPIAVTEFINITTKNPEDFTGTTAAKVSFVLGSSEYIVNGKATPMDAEPFIKDGRTMVPIRYVSQALGVSPEQVAWEQSTQTVTIIADKVIQVKLGSRTMVINGANVPMTASAELVSDRTFVPIAEIARALNVSVEWDEATKTATFN